MSQPRSAFSTTLPSKVPMQPATVTHATQATQVPFFVDHQFVPAGERRWSLAGPGKLDEHGRFTSPDDLSSDKAKVACEIWHNGVHWGQSSASVGFAESAENEGWQILNTFLIDTPAFSSLETPKLYANGRQQLNLMMTLEPSGEGLEIFPSELDTLRVFELMSHQEVAVLEGSDPVLSDNLQEWAIAWVANEYAQAAPDSPILVEDGPPRTAEHVSHCYLHTTVGNTVNRQFFAGIRDRFGAWHYSHDGTRKNVASVNPRKFAGQVDVHADRKSGFNIEPTQGSNWYHYNHVTVEYWIFTLQRFRIKTVQVVGDNISMARWERDSTSSRYCSYTGYVYKDSPMVQFDKKALESVNFKANTHLNKEAYLINDNQVAVCNFRVRDVYFSREPETLKGPVILDLVDVHGNGARVTVMYGPKGEENHRDVLQCSTQIL